MEIKKDTSNKNDFESSFFQRPRSKNNTFYLTEEEIKKKHIPIKTKRIKTWKKIAFFLIIILLLATLAYTTFFFFKIRKVSKIISNNSSSLSEDLRNTASLVSNQEKRKILSGEENGRINILLLGAAGENNAGKNLTDTIMIMSIDTKNKKMSLLSLPRDLYVEIPDSKTYTKINSLYAYALRNDKGIDYIKKSVEEITDQKIDYYLVTNYDAFKKIIDNMGGVNVTVERDILDTRFPGPNFSYETFEIKKGLHLMDGEIALKYVRERHDDPQGDFGRAKRQQQVIQAVRNKFFSAQTFLNVFKLNDILDTLGNNIKTNIELSDLESFIALSRQIDTQNINNIVIDAWKKDSLLKVSHVFLGGIRAFILVPRVGNYSEIKQAAATIFDTNALKTRTEKISSENASIAIINRSGDSTLNSKIYDLLKNKMSLSNTKIYNETTKNPTQNTTTVIDNTSKQKLYTLDELLKKLPATLSENNWQIKKTEDFIIILGTDLIDSYKYEEDSLEEFNNSEDSHDNIDFTKQFNN